MKLVPTTVLGKEESKKIKTILQFIFDKPESYEFQAPVDWKGTFLSSKEWDSPTTPSSSRTQWTWEQQPKSCVVKNIDTWSRRWTTYN